jgi:hypothetical protein
MAHKWFPRRPPADERSLGVEVAQYTKGPRRVSRAPRAVVGALRSSRQGRGRREMTPRTMRTPSESPISASSTAAWTANPTRSTPAAGAGLRPPAVVGTPPGWAGCRMRSGRPRKRLAAWRSRVEDSAGAVGVAGAGGRFSLRRCGRVRGNAPSTSDVRSSLIAVQSSRNRASHCAIAPPRRRGADRVTVRRSKPPNRVLRGIHRGSLETGREFVSIRWR